MLIQNKHRSNYSGAIRGVLIVAAFFLVIGVTVARDGFTRILFAVMTPLWRAEQSAFGGADARLSFFRVKQELVEENRSLKEKNIFLTAELYTLPILKKENQELREILGRRPLDGNFLLARVLARPNRSPYDTLIIDRGEKNGVRAGDVATVYGGIALGTIERVYAASSVVKLFSSPGQEIDVFIGEGNIPVSAEGRGGGNFNARVPKGIVVHEGDSVLFPSSATAFLGVVGAVEALPSDSFQNVFFRAPVNIYELKWVEILRGDGRGEDNETRISNSPN